MNGLHFKVKDIEDGAVLSASVVCMAEDIHLEAEDVNFNGPIHISVKLFREGTKVYVTGDIKNEAEIECGNCLEMFTTELNSHFDVQYYQTSDPEKLDWLDESTGIRYYGEARINISDDVRQAIVIEVPLWPKCSVNCRGLCYKCGHNLNSGPCDCSQLVSETSPFAVLADLLPEKHRKAILFSSLNRNSVLPAKSEVASKNGNCAENDTPSSGGDFRLNKAENPIG